MAKNTLDYLYYKKSGSKLVHSFGNYDITVIQTYEYSHTQDKSNL